MTILIEFSGPAIWLPHIAVLDGCLFVEWLWAHVGIMNEDYRTALVALVRVSQERKREAHDA